MSDLEVISRDSSMIAIYNSVFDRSIETVQPPICRHCGRPDPLIVEFDDLGLKYAVVNKEHVECKEILRREKEEKEEKDSRSIQANKFLVEYGLSTSEISQIGFDHADPEQHTQRLINILSRWTDAWNGTGSIYTKDGKQHYQKGVCLYGPSDIGKTYLMLCLAKKAISNGINLRMVSYHKLMDICAPAYTYNDLEKMKHEQEKLTLIQADILIIDDLFSSVPTEKQSQSLSDFLYEREIRIKNYLFITTNIDVNVLLKKENGPFGNNIITRLGYMTSFFPHTGGPYLPIRLKKEREALEMLGD